MFLLCSSAFYDLRSGNRRPVQAALVLRPVGYRKRRCIVPMDAFYEKKKGRLYKFFMKDRQPFGVAGI
jgi:hypothetical protein